jgi:hypothetical protein
MMPKAPWRTQTVPQVADRLGIGVKSLRSACSKGDVQTVMFNGTLMIPKAEEQRLAALFTPAFAAIPQDR